MGEAIALSSHITEQRTLSGVDSLVSDKINQALRGKGDTETLQGQFMKANPDFTEAMRSGGDPGDHVRRPAARSVFRPFMSSKPRRLAASQEQAVKAAYEKGRLETLEKGRCRAPKRCFSSPERGLRLKQNPTSENRPPIGYEGKAPVRSGPEPFRRYGGKPWLLKKNELQALTNEFFLGEKAGHLVSLERTSVHSPEENPSGRRRRVPEGRCRVRRKAREGRSATPR